MSLPPGWSTESSVGPDIAYLVHTACDTRSVWAYNLASRDGRHARDRFITDHSCTPQEIPE